MIRGQHGALGLTVFSRAVSPLVFCAFIRQYFSVLLLIHCWYAHDYCNNFVYYHHFQQICGWLLCTSVAVLLVTILNVLLVYNTQPRYSLLRLFFRLSLPCYPTAIIIPTSLTIQHSVLFILALGGHIYILMYQSVLHILTQTSTPVPTPHYPPPPTHPCLCGLLPVGFGMNTTRLIVAGDRRRGIRAHTHIDRVCCSWYTCSLTALSGLGCDTLTPYQIWCQNQGSKL